MKSNFVGCFKWAAVEKGCFSRRSLRAEGAALCRKLYRGDCVHVCVLNLSVCTSCCTCCFFTGCELVGATFLVFEFRVCIAELTPVEVILVALVGGCEGDPTLRGSRDDKIVLYPTSISRCTGKCSIYMQNESGFGGCNIWSVAPAITSAAVGELCAPQSKHCSADVAKWGSFWVWSILFTCVCSLFTVGFSLYSENKVIIYIFFLS